MRAVFLGGPKDGTELEIRDGAQEWFMPVPVKRLTVTDMMSPYVQPSTSTTAEVKWPVRRITSPAGRKYTAIIEPTLHEWLIKNFPQTKG